jgi:hypothetical protein
VSARLLIGVCLAIITLTGLAFAETITPADVTNRTNKKTHTSVEIKKYVSSLKGKSFAASGTVHDVQEGHSGYKIVVNADVPGRSKPFIVDVFMKNGGKFRKGSEVSCTGKITRFNRFTYNGIGIEGNCR